MSKISIIIPTINEANNLPLLLSDLSSIQKEGEIIIVDCGSEDKTIDIANIYGAKVFISKEKNRGLQLDIGAKNSKGEWLIFCLLYTSPSPRDHTRSRMPSSA